MAVDCGIELKEHNVAFVSIWPGPAKTEQILSVVASLKGNEAQQMLVSLSDLYTITFELNDIGLW